MVDATAATGGTKRGAAHAARPSGRPPAKRGTISRERVVTAAAAEIAAGRFEQLTVRHLAARLGVAPMSLYRHIRDKDDLLDEVVDRLLAPAWRPDADPSDARAWITEAVERFRAFLVSQPAALQVFLAHPVTSPAAMSRMRAMLDVLGSAGLTEAQARSQYAVIQTYTLGFAALEASRARWNAEHQDLPDEEIAWLTTFTSASQFAAGLNALLAGALTLR